MDKKYHRLLERRKRLVELAFQTENPREQTQYFMEQDCINHFFECDGYRTYETIAEFCKVNGIERVVDIGCAYGHQSECFLQYEIDYLGVNDEVRDFWNQDRFAYISARYPCPLPTHKGDLGVSVLCLTWNCYLYEGEKTLISQCEALSRDFEHCLLYITEEAKSFIHGRYFKEVQQLSRNLFYFKNPSVSLSIL